ncbi:glycosyl hydrolase family 85 [Dictyocaulus viviparus]|uniref:Glycosyl hydrolase family 85 n=1 Tax=Dictyocaulus viviparus TaxID=29172 RepID=A0A0D8Y736_DICVI|nr:glycosyl hydrolase family 85 [Dictyocaulus viviparus]
MRQAIGFSRVIWYDSVTVTGKLNWQNMLNTHNRGWFECCDGIYLNYNWTDEMLLRSADSGTLNKIFVGIDCFARGCVGGWDCYRSFAKANLMRMSIALFAPGWICEKFPNENPIEHGLRFWKKLALYTPARPILTLPVSTNFCTGFTFDNQGVVSHLTKITHIGCIPHIKRFSVNSMSVQPHFVGSLLGPTPTISGGLLLPKCSCIR